MKKQYHLCAFFFFILSCNNADERKTTEVISSTSNKVVTRPINAVFNCELIPDTSLKWAIIEGQKISKQISFEQFVVEKGDEVFLVNSTTKLWPGNFPDLFKNGDTVLISGNIYTVPGSETMPGYPIFINSIYFRTDYKSGRVHK